MFKPLTLSALALTILSTTALAPISASAAPNGAFAGGYVPHPPAGISAAPFGGPRGRYVRRLPAGTPAASFAGHLGGGYVPLPPGGTGGLLGKLVDNSAMVVQFAVGKLGQRIGRGQCTDLVDAALAAAHARPGNNYVWGTQLWQGPLGPRGRFIAYRFHKGDIIQFEGAHFQRPDGLQSWDMPHHTAIIESLAGSQVTLIDQNDPVGGAVTRQRPIDLAWLQTGTFTIYRPIPQ